MKRAERDSRRQRLSRSRRLGPIALALGIVACGSTGYTGRATSAGISPARIRLAIRYWPHGQGTGRERLWTLTCQPTGGTHPRPGAACAELAASSAPFAPPAGVCPMIIVAGSPQAQVTGHVASQRISAFVRPRCGTAWARLHILLTGS